MDSRASMACASRSSTRTTRRAQGPRFGAIVKDREGDLWLWIESGEVTRYPRRTIYDVHDRPGRPRPELVGFTQDEAGRLLIVSPGAIRRYYPSLDRFVEIEWPAFVTGYHRLLWDATGSGEPTRRACTCSIAGAGRRIRCPRASAGGRSRWWPGPRTVPSGSNRRTAACHAANGVARPAAAAADGRARGVNGRLSATARGETWTDGRSTRCPDAAQSRCPCPGGDRTTATSPPSSKIAKGASGWGPTAAVSG